MPATRFSLFRAGAVLAAACTMLTAALAAGPGCSAQNETYHFASVDRSSSTPRVKFYRVRVRASSFLCKSSYQAGLYDANALHSLFGQVNEPSSQASSSPQTATVCNDGSVRIIDSDKRFAILYGANADAMADQISAFASNAETGDQIGSLLAATSVRGVDYEDAILKANDATVAKKEAADLAGKLKGWAGDLDKSDVADNAVVKILDDAVYASKRAAAAAGTPTSAPATPAKETPAKTTPPKETPAKETPAKETPAKDTPPKDTPPKDTPPKDTPPKDTPPKGTAAGTPTTSKAPG